MHRTSRIAATALAVVACGAFSATSAGGTSRARAPETPVAFLEHVVSSLAANDYRTAWQTLHPLHQAVAAEDEYVACEELSPIAARLASLKPIRTRRKGVAVAGMTRLVRGVVVTFRLRLSDPASAASTSFTLNAATVRVGGRWAWMLPRSRYDLYARDGCFEDSA